MPVTSFRRDEQRRQSAGAILLAASALAAVQLSSPVEARAQSGGDGFLFTPPKFTVGIRGGYHAPRADGDLFDHTIDQLTVGRSDFGGNYLGVDFGFRTGERLDLVFGFDLTGSQTRSEFRNWIDDQDMPIEQTTTYKTVGLSLGGRYYLFDRGRRIGRFAWVPRSANLYVGAGAGGARYEWEQYGDWVDFQTYDIFWDVFVSEGWTLAAHVMAGAELHVANGFLLTSEAKFRLARGPLDERTFYGFTDGVDMTGLSLSVGIAFRR